MYVQIVWGRWRHPLLMKLFFQIICRVFPQELFLHLHNSVLHPCTEYVKTMLKSTSNPQVEFKGSVKSLLKNLYYVIKLPC